MSLVFAAVTPHPPLLIPGIGKNELEKVKKTKEAMEQIEQDLYLAKPNIIIVISPHGSIYKDAFCINAHTDFVSDFEQFGDFETKMKWRGSPDFAAHIAHAGYEHNVPVQIMDEQKLDHGSTVPLFYLTQHLPDVKVLPVGYSELGTKEHLAFGNVLKDLIAQSDKRIAIIASGDLSHGLTTDAPAGFSKVGKQFDDKIIELLQTRNTVGYTSLDNTFVEDAAQCGYRSFLIALGVLQNVNYTFKNLSYEGPFGVGYLTGEFIF